MKSRLVLTGVVLLSCLITPTPGWCDHRLQFVNGGAIVVSRYRQTGKTIGCEYGGGWMEIPVSRIKNVSNCLPPSEKGIYRMPLMLLPGPAKDLHIRSETGEPGLKAGTPLSPSRVEAYGEKQRLKHRLQESLERFRKASKARDLKGKKSAIAEMTRISARLSHYR